MVDRQTLQDRFVRDLKDAFGARARGVALCQMNGADADVSAVWKMISEQLRDDDVADVPNAAAQGALRARQA